MIFIFFWDKNLLFHYIKKVPSNNINGKGNFLEDVQKNHHILRKREKVMKSPRNF